MKLDDEWICQEEDGDYVIERFEIRLKGRKPLVLESPTVRHLVNVTSQYLNITTQQTHQFLAQAILYTPEPFSIEEHFRLIEALKKHLDINKESHRALSRTYPS